jgi:hypothetical protein
MVRLLLAAVFAAAGHGQQAHLGTAVTATFSQGASHGVVCVVGGRCRRVER